MSHAHTELVELTLALIGARKDCRVWKNATGVARSLDGSRVIRFGKTDTPDIIGFTSDGRFLGFECKTGKAVKTPGQKNFARLATRYGCRVIEVRDAKDAEAFLDSLRLPKIELTPEFFR